MLLNQVSTNQALNSKNHLREKRRHEITTENQPSRVEFLSYNLPSNKTLDTIREQVTDVETTELEVLTWPDALTPTRHLKMKNL